MMIITAPSIIAILKCSKNEKLLFNKNLFYFILFNKIKYKIEIYKIFKKFIY